MPHSPSNPTVPALPPTKRTFSRLRVKTSPHGSRLQPTPPQVAALGCVCLSTAPLRGTSLWRWRRSYGDLVGAVARGQEGRLYKPAMVLRHLTSCCSFGPVDRLSDKGVIAIVLSRVVKRGPRPRSSHGSCSNGKVRVHHPEPDPQEAKALLERAGWSATGKNGMVNIATRARVLQIDYAEDADDGSAAPLGSWRLRASRYVHSRCRKSMTYSCGTCVLEGGVANGGCSRDENPFR